MIALLLTPDRNVSNLGIFIILLFCYSFVYGSQPANDPIYQIPMT